MANIQWLSHKGKKVLLLEFVHQTGARAEELAREVQQVITAQSPGSLLVLADFSGMSFREETVRQIAKVAAVNRDFVRLTAWVGTEGLPEEWFQSIQETSRRVIHRFATREEALEFLSGNS